MKIYKNKAFSKWALKTGLLDQMLVTAVVEMEDGLVDAELGGHIFKKRVSVGNRGKSGGVRTLLAYKINNKAFFIYGFEKSARANITNDELKALKLYAKMLLKYTDRELKQAVENGVLIEVKK